MLEKKLAIVVPAYKTKYLRRTLESLACQSNKNFTVYFGDDNSPEDIKTIVSEYKHLMNIKYVRFASNIGRRSLVEHWRRCVALTSEYYIWMFADDDIMPKDAVERFWKFESGCEFDICRFNLQIVDRDERTIVDLGEHPEWQSSVDFLVDRLKFATLSAASEYIFTRDVYDKCGFVEFPCAWCSDDASWIQMGQSKGIWTIKGHPVQMRMSGMNISSNKIYNKQKFKAVLRFVSWIYDNYKETICHCLFFVYLRSQLRSLQPSLSARLGLYKLEMLSCMDKSVLFVNNRYLYKLYKHV